MVNISKVNKQNKPKGRLGDGSPGVYLEQPFIAPADGKIVGLTINLTDTLVTGALGIYILVNESPQHFYVMDTSVYGLINTGYEIFSNYPINLVAGDRVTCTITADHYYTDNSGYQRVQLDLFMEFPGLPVAYVPPVPPLP